jgi:capsular polysaccharide biosynthesis protein
LTQSYHTPLAATTWQTIRDGFDTGHGESDLYVSRSLVGGRKLTNEAEVEAEFASRGFAIVHPERLPIATQVNLWANARRVAGPGGSGVFNVVFKRKLEKAFFLHSPNMVRLSEILLQGADPVETTYYVGASERRDVHAPWLVDMEDLRARLDEWMG